MSVSNIVPTNEKNTNNVKPTDTTTKGLEGSKNLFTHRAFFVQCIEKSSEKRENPTSISQLCLNALRIPLTTKSTFKKEVSDETKSKAVAKALLSTEEIPLLVTRKKMRKLKRNLYSTWSNICLSSLQLLNLAKMSVVFDARGNGDFVFATSEDPETDRSLVNANYCIGGLGIELAFLLEVLPCIPLKSSREGVFILNNPGCVYDNLAATILANFPVKNKKNIRKELTVSDMMALLVIVLKGMGGSLSPSSLFKNFALKNALNNEFLANSPTSYIVDLRKFYLENLLEHNPWWLCIDEDDQGELTILDQTMMFDQIKV